MIVLMIKQILKSEQPNQDLVALSAQAQGAAYQAQVKAKGKGHAFGPPQFWVFGGLIDALVRQGDMAGAQTATDLKKDMAEESKCELVRFFWVSKTCNKELLRLS